MLKLRDYQDTMFSRIVQSWGEGARNVCSVLPTGGGKTVIFGAVLDRYNVPRIAIAHRQELVSQISMTLARYGITHNIIASRNTVKWISQLQASTFGRPYYSPDSSCIVAGVDTLLTRRQRAVFPFERIKLWVIDECHHVVRDNKWGKAVELFGNAWGLGVTATPFRADGKGLGRQADGVMDSLIVGASMRQLINRGYLTDYTIFGPLSNIDLTGVDISSNTGDFNLVQLRKAVRSSRIIGDIVQSYLEIAPGKLGVTFTTEIRMAAEIAERFNAQGVPAAAISAKTPDRVRRTLLDRLARGELRQLINVDLFGEGFDLPAIEVISLGRPTESYALHAQQFGRALRPMEGKGRAIIIDHVGNTIKHGPPDQDFPWSLDRLNKQKKKPVDPMKLCQNCTYIYPRFEKVCPNCGYTNPIGDRGSITACDGDLLEFSPELIAALRGEVSRIDEDPEDVRQRLLNAHAPAVVANSAAKRHRERQEAQAGLRWSIEHWANQGRAEGRPDSYLYKKFFDRFGIDVLSAQALGRPEAERLIGEIWGTA